MKSTISVLAFLALVHVAVGASPEDKPVSEKRRVYDAEKKVSLIPPPDWDKETAKKGEWMIISLQTSNPEDNKANVNVIKAPAPSEVDEAVTNGLLPQLEAEKALAEVLRAIRLNRRDVAVHAKGTKTVNGRTAIYVCYSVATNSPQEDLKRLVFAQQMVFAGDGYSYTMTYTLPPKSYERLKASIWESLESIRIEK